MQFSGWVELGLGLERRKLILSLHLLFGSRRGFGYMHTLVPSILTTTSLLMHKRGIQFVRCALILIGPHPNYSKLDKAYRDQARGRPPKKKSLPQHLTRPYSLAAHGRVYELHETDARAVETGGVG